MLQFTDGITGKVVWIAAWQIVRLHAQGDDLTQVHTLGNQFVVAKGAAQLIAKDVTRAMRGVYQTPDYRE